MKVRILIKVTIFQIYQFSLKHIWSLFGVILVLPICFVIIFNFYNPSKSFYINSEIKRLGKIEQEWVDIEKLPKVVSRSAVAAEDANFCTHHGFDIDAIFAVIRSGANRGASTISQQVAKNVFLWHGRNYLRKGLEVGFTVLIELIWSKKRILEVYLNVAEFDEGVFGVEAAARHYFGVKSEVLSARQAARLAAILPSPQIRSASKPSNSVIKRTRQIIDGAATIRADGRSACFES